MEIVHPIDHVHPQILPAPHFVRRVEVVAPAVVDRPLIDSPCRGGDLCDRFERATAANRSERGTLAERFERANAVNRLERETLADRFERATFAEQLAEQNIALRRAETQAESLERFVPDRTEPTPTTRSDRRRDITLEPAPRVELPEISKPIYRDVIDRRIELVDVLSRGNLLDILA